MTKKENKPTTVSANKKQIDLSKRFWEGCVGVCIRPQPKNDGTYFWKYATIRSFKRIGGSGWEYDHYFTMSNNDALAEALSQAMRFMANTDPDMWVNEKYQEYLEAEFDTPIEEAA